MPDPVDEGPPEEPLLATLAELPVDPLPVTPALLDDPPPVPAIAPPVPAAVAPPVPALLAVPELPVKATKASPHAPEHSVIEARTSSSRLKFGHVCEPLVPAGS